MVMIDCEVPPKDDNDPRWNKDLCSKCIFMESGECEHERISDFWHELDYPEMVTLCEGFIRRSKK